MDDIILNNTVAAGNRVVFEFSARGEMHNFFTTDQMFVEYDTPIDNIPVSILNTAFISSIIPLVWLSNTTLWVDELDRTFYDCLYRLREAYRDLYPDVPLKGKVVVARLIENSYIPERESLLLFSGGIDAHVSYIRLKETNPVLCNIQGWFKEQPDERSVAAEADRRDISTFAKEKSLDFVYAKSNFAVLVSYDQYQKRYAKLVGDSWWHGFQHSMSFISIAIPVAYMLRVRNIYIASSFSLGRPGKCASYATTDIEFKFAKAGGCIHDAFELSRQEKVHTLVEYQKISGKPYPVRVCSFNDHNCCECEKCFRTILEIIAENGDIRNFGFEIDNSLKNHWQAVMDKKLYGFGVEGENRKHWPDTIKRMNDNYKNIDDKEFVDWFLNYDFIGNRKKALREYYRKNFFSILKRKIKSRKNY